jgi:hypothetical protein
MKIACVTPDGSLIHDPEQPSTRGWRDNELSQTVFSAAVDAHQYCPWERDSHEFSRSPVKHNNQPPKESHNERTSWSTQCRWLHWLSMLMGVAVEMSETTRARMASLLGVALITLKEGKALIAKHCGYVSRGEAIYHVHQRMRRNGQHVFHLLAAGYEAGLWGQPLYWNEKQRQLRDIPFRPKGTRDRTAPKNGP